MCRKLKVKDKARKRREMGVIEDKHILPTRLRSESGKLYTTSVTVDTSSSTSEQTKTNVLESVGEEDSSFQDGSDSEVDMALCNEGKGCKGYSKLVSLITKLQTSVDGFVNEMSRQRLVNADFEEDIKRIEDDVQDHSSEIDSIYKELEQNRHQLKTVTNIVIRQDQQIAILNRKIAEMQQREMNPNIIISGILEKPSENPIQLFNAFVMDKLEIQELIPANQAFRLGNGKNRPLIVELRDPQTFKRKLFASATKLKGKKNQNGKPYFLADHLPEVMHENRRRINEIVAENKKKPADKQFNMELKRGVLSIDGVQYEKEIETPTALDLLKPSEEVRKLACEIDLVRGTTKTRNKSKFCAFAAAVSNFKDIQAAYLKVKMKFADATHVACVYRLPGNETFILQDYVDDSEYGAGRTLLRVLKDEQYLNMAIFMVRYYGGKHIGTARFDIFREVASTAVKALIKKRTEESSQPPVEPVPDKVFQPNPWTTPTPYESQQENTDPICTNSSLTNFK